MKSKELTKSIFGSVLDFDTDAHQYSDDKVVFKGVTTTIGKYFPKFVIEEQAKDYSKRLSYKGIIKSAEEIIQEWDEKREYGTQVHNQIEEYLLHPFVASSGNEELNKDVTKALHIVEGLTHLYNIVAVFPEVQVWDKELGLAGTVDLLLQLEDGSFIMADWKTSNSIFKGKSPHNHHPLTQHLDNTNYNKYSLQMGVYSAILERHSVTIRECLLIHLPPKSPMTDYTIYSVNPDQGVVQGIIANCVGVGNEELY